MSRRFPRAGSIASLGSGRIFLIACNCAGSEPHAAQTDECLGERRALEDSVGALFEAHRALGRRPVRAVARLGSDRECPRGAQTVAADARAVVPLDHRTVERPRCMAEVAEDILHSDIVRIGAVTAHAPSIVAHRLR